MTAVATRAATLFAVPVGELHPNRANPRAALGDLEDLTQSISEHGVLQPLIAMRRPAGGFTILAGHRRHAAARRAKLTTVPVLIIGDKLPDDQLTLALIENLHRAQLSPMDEARACQALLDHGRSRKDIAFDLARSGNWVADRLALLALPVELQRKVDSGDMPIGKAADLGKKVAKTGSGSVTLGARADYYFTVRHQLADTATARCNRAGHPPLGRVGPACGRCWESTIRDDERGAA